MEQAGAVIFKDASANKGGVTSSSLEVLAALALTDDEFAEWMCIAPHGDSSPSFYTEYVSEVHRIIERNARAEFEFIWREHAAHPNKTNSLISDELSLAIGQLDDEIRASPQLWSNEALRRLVLEDALPRLLLERVGSEKIMERVPETYLRAIFSSFLASHFIFAHGTSPGQLAFYDFMSRYFERITEIECRRMASSTSLHQ